MFEIKAYGINEQTYSQFIDSYEYIWNVSELYVCAEHMPIFELELDTVINLLKITWFQDKNELMLGNLIKHFQRVLSADINQPILLAPNGQVLDGLHRIVRACLEGEKFIKAKRLEKMPSPVKILET